MKVKLLISTLLLGSALLAYAAKDPVLMKINGKEVKLSEFEYLYHKNNQQQVEKETLEQYLERFINYKLKVADAESQRLDTLPAFVKEFDGYKQDLVKPFLEDTTVRERLILEAYERTKKNVDVDHLMLSLGRDYEDDQRQRAIADSLRQRIIAGDNFEELVAKFSIDPSASRNKGHYGFITAGTMPYVWESAAYNTPVGEVSQPVKTNWGYHLIRVNAVRDDQGQVHAQHILKLFPRGDSSDSAKAATKAKIDAVYAMVCAPGADFSEIAKAESDDPGSKAKGGDLGWFGRGRMVKPFEDAAFNAADGEITKPFETNYGYHIIKKIGWKPTPDLSEVRKNIEARIAQDERATMPRTERIKQIKEMYGYKDNNKLYDYLVKALTDNGGYDSTFAVNVLAKSKEPIGTFAGNKTIELSAIGKLLNPKAKFASPKSAADYIMQGVPGFSDNYMLKYYTDNLINDDPEYRNLINEYRDGMLLFEASNRRVWEGASRDTTGLRQFFEQNRSKYRWTEPHFKGILISADSDSTLQAALAERDAMRAQGAPLDTITLRLHRKYRNTIKMERMTFGRGENPNVDYLFFNGPAPEPNPKFPKIAEFEGKILQQPEALADVKGLVTSDYQDELEKRWIAELKAKYPVEVNKKLLKKVKP